jgi:hypothetical protein
MYLHPFQRRDFAAAALRDGVILSLEQGLGKSFAAFTIPFLWRSPRVLLVAPGDLHNQLKQTAARFFGLALIRLAKVEDLFAHGLHLPAAPLSDGAMPRYFLVSYEALCLNGADEAMEHPDFPSLARRRSRLIEARALAKIHVMARLLGHPPKFADYFIGIGKEREGITCLWAPSMARALKAMEGCGAGFHTIVLDEATRIQGDSATTRALTLLSPAKRLLLTGTPIKNRLESIFPLAWWAAGSASEPTTRWPYGPNDRDKFAKAHLEVDRFLTREEEKAARERKRRSAVRISKTSPRVCNVQRLWRLLAPIVLRRRKADAGIPIVPKTLRPVAIGLGSAQATVYKEHLEHRPTHSSTGGRISAFSAVGLQLTNLRQAALCPDTESLGQVTSNAHPNRKRSWTPWTPKLAAILSLIADLMNQGEQVMVGSPFTRFSIILHAQLREASVKAILLNGSVSPTERGVLAAHFKRKRFPVLVAGLASMAHGHSFENCSHLILPSYSWAMDENTQFIDRVWRLNSPKPVTIYTLTATKTIDERLLESYTDKADTAQLALDGQLFPDTVEDLDPELLLAQIYDSFHSNTLETIDESLLEQGWPDLARRLKWAQARYNEFHPPIVKPAVTAAEIKEAIAQNLTHDPLLDHAIAKQRFLNFLNQNRPRP